MWSSFEGDAARSWVGAALAAGVIAGAGLGGCAPPIPPPGTYVGVLGGSDAVMGLVTTESAGIAYTCGGPQTLDTIHAWFAFDAIDVEMASSGYDASVTLTAEEDRWRGTVTDPDGNTYTVTLSAAEGAEGPFATDQESECAAGAVVVSDGGTERLQGVVCIAGRAPAQVVPVGQITDGPIDVQSDTDPPVSFVVAPATP